MASGKKTPYRHRRIEDDEIRLLSLEPEGPEGWNSKLRGELKTYTLTVERGEYDNSPLERRSSNGSFFTSKSPEAPQYDALSYTWGGDEDADTISEGSSIHIFDTAQSKKPFPSVAQTGNRGTESGFIKLTRNLEGALRNFRTELRQHRRPLRLWIDSICIRQDDNHYEKSNQIGKMADIYTEAERVRVWLGSGREALPDLRNFIRQILTLDKFDKMCETVEYAGKWNALRNLMHSPWFQRRWIIQEIAFARQADVHWGSNVIPWSELASAVQLFASKRVILRKMFQRSGVTHHDPDLIGEVEAYGATNLVDRIDKMLRKSEDGNIMESLFSLETILTTMTAFNVTKPHDTIYAIIQLSYDARPASDRTILQEKENLEKENGRSPPDFRFSDSRYNDQIKVFLSHHDHGISESPERSDSGSKPPARLDQNFLSSADEWTSIDRRGRTLARTAHASTHQAVRSDANARSRSRGRSPAEAKSIAERAYRKPRKRFIVDYDKSILNLCTEVLRFVTDESKSLDILVKPWAPCLTDADRDASDHAEDKIAFPSWIQPCSKRPFTLKDSAGLRKSIRVSADNLAGMQTQGFKTYNCSGIVPPDRPRHISFIDGRILSTRGFVLDKIGKIAEPALNAIIPARWLDLGWVGRRRNDESVPPEEFWRTLVANRQSSNGPIGPPLYWRQACEWTFSQQAQNGNLDTAELIYNFAISGHVSEPVGEFLQRVRAVVWDRALIRTEDDNASIGLLGLVPKEAQKGDLICILYGCSVPVVLRRKQRRIRQEWNPSTSRKRKRRRIEVEDEEMPGPRPSRTNTASSEASFVSSSSDGERAALNSRLHTLALEGSDPEEYSLIGECYIHGMMDGEAFSQLEKYKLSEREKVFRIGCAFDCTCKSCEPTLLNSVTEEE